MRCPECNHNQKYKDGTRCNQCRYSFVFRKKPDQISDFALRQIIQRLSDQGHYSFTATQLALEISRLWRKESSGPVSYSIVALIVSIIVGVVILNDGYGFGIVLFLVLLPLAIAWGQHNKSTLSIEKARQIIKQYHQIHPISALADGQAFRQSTPTADCQDPHYAPERILLVERDDLVDMLVRNHFHLTAKAAVVSRSGYPEHIFTVCQAFLRHHPQTPVFVIHDASMQGFALAAQLVADPQWQFASSHLTDLGLSRTTLDGDFLLPWLPISPARQRGFFGGNVTKRLQAGYRVPLDNISPKPMLNGLNAALVSGVLLLASESQNENGMEVEIDYG